MWTNGLTATLLIIVAVGVVISLLFLYLGENYDSDICEGISVFAIGSAAFAIVFWIIFSIVCVVRGESTSYKDYLVEKIQIEENAPTGMNISTEKGIKVFYMYKDTTEACYIKSYSDIIRDENIKVNYIRDYDNLWTHKELHLTTELYDAYIDVFQENNDENTIFEKDTGIIKDLSKDNKDDDSNDVYNIDNIENVETIIIN
jgi:hypothetical protein